MSDKASINRAPRHFVLAAGGTGGHMTPAHALAEELMKRGHHVALITDDRGARIPGLFDRVPVHILPAGRLSGGPIGWLRAGRGAFTLLANFSRRDVHVPVERTVETVLATHHATLEPGFVVLPPLSGALLK